MRAINERWRRDSLSAAIEVGEFLATALFGGSIERACAEGNRHPVLRALRRSRALPFPPAYLWTCIHLVSQTREFAAARVGALPYSHHRVLLGVGDRDKRIEIARVAAAGAWTRTKLWREVAGERTDSSRRGRPPKSPVSRVVDELDGLRAVVLGLESGDYAGEVDRLALVRSLSATRAVLDELQRELEGR